MRALFTTTLAAGMAALAPALQANVITDWDEKAVAMASIAADGQRELALVHLAMFDTVNSITPKYQPYGVRVKASPGASADAGAASAAAHVLKQVHPQSAGEIDKALAQYLAALPEQGKTEGVRLGAEVAEKCVVSRKADGFDAQDPFSITSKPGVYQPTMTMVGSVWPNMKPFGLKSASQFRPGPPVALASSEWAEAVTEVKEYGARNSSKRSPQQTETARFWLMVGTPAYHPVARQIIIAKKMNVIDSARFMAVYATALADAYVAVFDAKYHYNFWRPITAIQNAGIDGNPATEPDKLWRPLSDTPMHPEYPCAHCIQSGAAAGAIHALLGSQEIGQVELKSTTLPGVTHTFTNLKEFNDEVSNARVWAGFHYRFSTRVGVDTGRKVGEYVAQNLMLPVAQ